VIKGNLFIAFDRQQEVFSHRGLPEMVAQPVKCRVDRRTAGFRQGQGIQPLLLFDEHVDPHVAEQPGNVSQVPCGLVEKCGKIVQAGPQRLRPILNGFRHADADDREVKGRLGFVYPDKFELVVQGQDDPLQHGRIDDPGR
jgi:hypothetical protein